MRGLLDRMPATLLSSSKVLYVASGLMSYIERAGTLIALALRRRSISEEHTHSLSVIPPIFWFLFGRNFNMLETTK